MSTPWSPVGAPALPSVGALSRVKERLTAAHVVLWACFAIVGTAVVVPTGTLVWQSFTKSTPAGTVLALDSFARVLGKGATYQLLLNTVTFSAAMTVVAGALGFLFAWIAARTNAPGRRLMPIAILLPYLVPPTLGAITWILLLSPSNGIINMWLKALVGGAPFNIYSFAGMVFVESLYTFPLSFMFFFAALSSLNPTLEEASAVSGAGPLRTLWRTTVPSMWPTVLSVATLLFIIGLESFDVAWFLGYPAKIYLLSIEVFLLTRYKYPPDLGSAAVFGVIAFLAAVAMIAAYRRVTRQRERFATITGKGYRPGDLDIRWMRWPASIVFYLLVTVIGVLPVLLLLAISVDAVSWPFRITSRPSLENFRWILTDSESLRAIGNTAFLAIGGAFTVVILGFFVGYIGVRTQIRGRGVLDYLAFVPFAFPSTVLAVGIIGALITTPLYNTIWIMLLAFSIKFLPYGLRNLSNNMLQIHPELEEASYAAGAGLMRTLWRVVLPLTVPGIVAAWSLLLIVFMRQFSLPIMLSSPGSQVVTIMLFQEFEAGQMGHVAAFGMLLVGSCIPFIVVARYLGRASQSI
ncbi:MAG: iron ABC transporter permease [Candidatus Rokubacteria bacterium]|nr:iron ABC transporter permease [Candidatus Rokubacteria bacterium]